MLKSIGLIRVDTTDDTIAYAPEETPNSIEFYVCKPFDQNMATSGNGTMIAFYLDSREKVEQFHKVGLENGGKNEGEPGARPLKDDPYYAYIRDLDGNKICAFCDKLIEKWRKSISSPSESLIDKNKVFKLFAGSTELSPFHDCYATGSTILRACAGRLYAHYNGEDIPSVYWALRKQAAFFDVPERPIEVSGPDAI